MTPGEELFAALAKVWPFMGSFFGLQRRRRETAAKPRLRIA
jgi:hypothetical protein